MKIKILKTFLITFLSFLSYTICLVAQQPQWLPANGIDNNYIVGIDFYQKDPDTAYAIGTSGTFLSTDAGKNWSKVSSFLSDIGPIKIDPTNSKIIYTRVVWAIDPDFTVSYVSRDGGQTWQGLFTSLSRYEGGSIVEFDPNDPKTIYIGTGPGTLRKSTDGGDNWDSLALPENDMSCLAISQTNDNILYLGSIHGVLKSTDKGATWKQVGFSFQVNNVSSLVVDPTNPNIVYAGLFSFGGTLGGIYKSTDGGKTWNPQNNNIDSTDQSVGVLKINPKNHEQIFRMYSGPHPPRHLMYISTDGGNSWLDYDQGLSQSHGITSIAIDIKKNRVFVGTVSGIYFNDLILNNYYKPTPIFELYQNYPNPTNGSTTISYKLVFENFVTLEIYDVLGEKIKLLVNKFQYIGKHSVVFNVTGLASGTYFYKLTAGNYAQTKKIMVLK
jgi:photosystem II stability/assembly factor-like uncharacterized protein